MEYLGCSVGAVWVVVRQVKEQRGGDRTSIYKSVHSSEILASCPLAYNSEPGRFEGWVRTLRWFEVDVEAINWHRRWTAHSSTKGTCSKGNLTRIM